MPVKINELVVQIKVCGGAKEQVANPENIPAGALLHTTTEQQLALVRDVVQLLEEREAR